MLVFPWWNLPCSHQHAVVSIGLLPDGDYKEDGLPWIEPVERLGYLGWDRYCIYLRAAASTGLQLDGAHRKDGLPWMESTEKLGYYYFSMNRLYIDT
jgi:hypothetical protein